MTAGPIMIVPGSNNVLHYVARQLSGIEDVQVFNSANHVLWQARQTPPRVVMADVQLEDMSGAELAEILPNFAPNTRILICGQAPPEMIGQIQAVGAEYLTLDGDARQSVVAVYQALGMDPPAALPSTTELRHTPALVATATEPRAAVPTPPTPSPTPRAAETGVLPPPPSLPSPTQPRPKPVPPAALPTPQKEVPAPAAPAPAPDTFAAPGALVMQPQQYQVLTKLLDLLAREIGAQCVLLIDPAGMVLVQSGALPNLVMELIGPLLATSFSTTSQLARHLQEQNTNATYIHEGDRYDIYAFNVSYRVSLIIMFDKRVNPGKLGTVWVFAKRAMRELQRILKL